MQKNDISIVILDDRKLINDIVDIHLNAFPSFFLTFLGKNFLYTLYSGFMQHEDSGIIISKNKKSGEILGFLAYSRDLSGFYKWLLKNKLFQFALSSISAVFRNPKALFRLLRAFLYPKQAEKKDKYIEVSSIGVNPIFSNLGIGSMLLNSINNLVNTEGYKFIELTTDAVNNELANYFYQKNGFILNRTYQTAEGRAMNEYRREINNER